MTSLASFTLEASIACVPKYVQESLLEISNLYNCHKFYDLHGLHDLLSTYDLHTFYYYNGLKSQRSIYDMNLFDDLHILMNYIA